MEEPNNTTGAAPTPESQAPVCTGNCKECKPYQLQYCAAQTGYYAMQHLSVLGTAIASLQEKVNQLSDTIAEMKGSKELVDAPKIVNRKSSNRK